MIIINIIISIIILINIIFIYKRVYFHSVFLHSVFLSSSHLCRSLSLPLLHALAPSTQPPGISLQSTVLTTHPPVHSWRISRPSSKLSTLSQSVSQPASSSALITYSWEICFSCCGGEIDDFSWLREDEMIPVAKSEAAYVLPGHYDYYFGMGLWMLKTLSLSLSLVSLNTLGATNTFML